VPTDSLDLRAGPVRLRFDPDWGMLRGFMVDGCEALRAIYPAVRSSKWKTAPPRLRDLQVEDGEDSFRLTFSCDHVDAELGIDFGWKGELSGTADGKITYAFDGEARIAMATNRTGLCVLHPIATTAGRPVAVTHTDGRVERTAFPGLISPHQPFFEVAELRHEVRPGVDARVVLEGDTFETEDQRNWTDASFKTYGGALSTPLPLLFPVGHRVRQVVTFSLVAERTVPAVAPDQPVVRILLPPCGSLPLPSIGTRLAPEAGDPEPEAIDTWRHLQPGHFLVDVDLTAADWRAAFHRGQAWASAVGVAVVLRLVITPNHQPALAGLAEALAAAAAEVLAVTVVCPGEPCPGAVTMGLVEAALARVALTVPVAAAPADNFADMNRFRPSPAYWVAPPMCPQVHTFDHDSLMENLEAQAALLATARSFNPHPLVVGPVALLRRRVPDPRQGSLFAAAWTAGSLATVVPSGLVAAVTYHEHAGPMGIPGTPCQAVFDGLAGAVYTAPTVVSHPATMTALTVFTLQGERRVLLANLTRSSVVMSFDDGGEEIEFGPYASAWIET